MLGERLVMLADDLCHLGLKPIATSSESSSSEKWTVLSLVLSQHIKNGKHISSLEFVNCKYCTLNLVFVTRILEVSVQRSIRTSFSLQTETSTNLIPDGSWCPGTDFSVTWLFINLQNLNILLSSRHSFNVGCFVMCFTARWMKSERPSGFFLTYLCKSKYSM